MNVINVTGESGQCLATFITKSLHGYLEGTVFHTPLSDQLQVGTLKHKKGKVVTAHRHTEIDIRVAKRVEVIVILKGTVRFDIYDVTEVQSQVLCAGDVAILKAGGHGLEVLEDCEMVEVKQGPYAKSTEDKTFIRR